ncbi:hypothetical protein [Marinitenerispora sediminis]|uniref:Integral membrane protein n=1 Tax=Marinitenerispora sediminis TaxID=1931232 RepID=A0A368T7K5_9ACTN|nr:hypothetical protein [Marinitenerispora sediminis]RCV51091.1 hypothetical protein DEF28_16355 [Marinitenerispora sediminis]RCV56588.1 hypothetical protein DEF23_12390 [Marinitenerispora sediminis]RCV60086.1 hypothetical protein DEF24_08010 [Marinitenerispora sediminis]
MPDERLVELRIHGVNGGAADELLEVETCARVSGDDLAGFFRWRTAEDTQSVPGVPREVFAWGNLTSGQSSRALWLMLLPFMLVNVAYWMRPRRLVEPTSRGQRVADHSYGMLVRLLALSLTALLTMAAAGIGMDLIGWQCAGYGAACAELRPWLGFLAAPGAPFASPGRAVAAGAVLPLVAVVVLWRLSRRTGIEYVVTAKSDARRGPTAPLSDPTFWRNGVVMGRLRSVHVAIAVSVVTALLLLPPLLRDRDAGIPLPGAALAGLLALVVVLSVVGALVPDENPRRNVRTAHVCRWLRDAALLLFVLTLGYALWPRPGWSATGSLPGYAAGLNALFAAQCALVLLLVAVAVLQYRGAHPHAGTAMGGMAGPATAAFGALLGGVFSAAFVYQAAGLLGGCYYPGAENAGCLNLYPPSAYAWLQLAFSLEAAIALVGAGVLWAAARHRARSAVPVVAAEYDVDPDARRTREIAKARALGSMTEYLPAFLALLLLPALALVVLVLYSLATDGVAAADSGTSSVGVSLTAMTGAATTTVQHAVSVMVTVGSWLGGALLVGLVWLGRNAYRDQPTRKAVGVLWDIGTFWPRAAHPLAPPCYAERAVPQLAARVAALTARGKGVVLSGHSQGSVLAAATVWQLPNRCRERVVLLTHGSPLYRLYGRYFPAYFGPAALTELRQRVTAWCNLWRATDAIGGPVHLPGGTVARAEPLPDPRYYDHQEGDALYPEILGHSRYTADPAYTAAMATAADQLDAALEAAAARERSAEAAVPPQLRAAVDPDADGMEHDARA